MVNRLTRINWLNQIDGILENIECILEEVQDLYALLDNEEGS